jgi:hypothetical protein
VGLRRVSHLIVCYPTPLIHGHILPTPDSKSQDKTKKQRAKDGVAGAKAAKEKLQAVLDNLKSEDGVAAPDPKKRKRKP